MPQVTLSVPHEKLPILQDFLSALGIEDKKIVNGSSRTSIKSKMAKSVKDSANSFYKKYFSWEYFSNELEFE